MNSRGNAPTGSDHVIGVFSRDALSTALAATHRAGFGPHTRVLDGARANAVQQLARAGLTVREGSEPPAEAILVVVTAPGRAAIVSDLFARLGAESVHFASRRQEPIPAHRESGSAVPDVRIGEDAATGADA